MTPKTQSVCIDKTTCASGWWCNTHNRTWPHEPVAEPASTGEPKCAAIVNDHGFVPDICGRPLGYEGDHKYIVAARPSKPSAPQTSAEQKGESKCAESNAYVESGISSLTGRYDATNAIAPCVAPQPVSGGAPKVEEIAREIATATSACDSLNEIRRKTEAILRRYFPLASTARKSPNSHLGAVRD